MYLNVLVIFKSISHIQYVLKYHYVLNKCNSEKAADFHFSNLQGPRCSQRTLQSHFSSGQRFNSCELCHALTLLRLHYFYMLLYRTLTNILLSIIINN